MEVNVTNVAFALEAESHKKLSALMLENNLKHQRWFNYQITSSGKKFQAWFFTEVSTQIALMKELEKIDKGK